MQGMHNDKKTVQKREQKVSKADDNRNKPSNPNVENKSETKNSDNENIENGSDDIENEDNGDKEVKNYYLRAVVYSL